MKRADEQVIQALVALNSDPYFKRVKQWFEESLQDQNEYNAVELNEAILRQGQGKAQELSDFLKQAKGAMEVHHKMMNKSMTLPRGMQD